MPSKQTHYLLLYDCHVHHPRLRVHEAQTPAQKQTSLEIGARQQSPMEAEWPSGLGHWCYNMEVPGSRPPPCH